jgi:hypothetical protein
MALPRKQETTLILQIDAGKQSLVCRAEDVLQHQPVIRLLFTKLHASIRDRDSFELKNKWWDETISHHLGKPQFSVSGKHRRLEANVTGVRQEAIPRRLRR